MNEIDQETNGIIIKSLEDCLGINNAIRVWPKILAEIDMIGSDPLFEKYLYGAGDNAEERLSYSFGAILYDWYAEKDKNALVWLLSDLFHFGGGERADDLDAHFWNLNDHNKGVMYNMLNALGPDLMVSLAYLISHMPHQPIELSKDGILENMFVKNGISRPPFFFSEAEDSIYLGIGLLHYTHGWEDFKKITSRSLFDFIKDVTDDLIYDVEEISMVEEALSTGDHFPIEEVNILEDVDSDPNKWDDDPRMKQFVQETKNDNIDKIKIVKGTFDLLHEEVRKNSS
jgi:hypothetical protein